ASPGVPSTRKSKKAGVLASTLLSKWLRILVGASAEGVCGRAGTARRKRSRKPDPLMKTLMVAKKRSFPTKIPCVMTNTVSFYRREKDGYVFTLDRANVERLKAIPEFEGREEPAVADEFLRFRVEGWAENLADAGAGPGEVAVQLDAHQRKVH